MTVSQSFLDIFRDVDLRPSRIPLLEADAGAEGPHVWLTSCIHGDEVGGIVIVQEVFNWIRRRPLVRGRLSAFPLINPEGFTSMSRYINFQGEDLNRCFPGNEAGTMGERIAAAVFGAIRNSGTDLVIDLHNDWIRSIPYLVLDVMPEAGAERSALIDRTKSMARATGFLLVEESETAAAMRRTLSYAALSAGIPAFTLEVGGAFQVQEENVNRGVKAILNVLISLGMLDEPPIGDVAFYYPDEFNEATLTYHSKPACGHSGVIRFQQQPGAVVREGDTLATIQNAFGETLEVLHAEAEGILLGYSDYALALPGADVMAFGINARQRVQ